MQEKFTNLLKNKAIMDILLSIEFNKTATDIQYNTKISYSHVLKCLRLLQQYGLIRISEVGNAKVLYYTSKGEQISALLNKINKIYTEG